MASNPRSRSLAESQSGGKIVRPRRTTSAKTPYERPKPSNSASKSPNWFSRFISSPARFVAAGAGKLLSSAINLEDSPTSSSDSSYGSDSSAERQNSAFDDHNDVGYDAFKKRKSLEVINYSGKELIPLVGNSKNKQVIVQLLKQETFSREECDQLIKIIRSRVADSATNEDGGEKRPSEISNRTLGSDANTPDICSAAVLEAKKWLKEKKSGFDSKSDLDRGSHSSNLVTLPGAFEDEGSPVNVARSYMRQCPPWASPSIDHSKSSPPTGIQLFKEETAYPIIGNSTSSSKLKRDSPATGSWSIQDEIRRVQSRATEEMLRTCPSSKMDWSAITVEYKHNPNSSATENKEANTGEKLHSSTSSIDASLHLAKGLGTQASPGLQDDRREITAIGEQVRSSGDMMTMVHSDDGLVKVDDIDDSNVANHKLNSILETREVSNRLCDGSCSVFKEKVGAENTLANGFSGPGFSAEKLFEQNTTILNNEHSIQPT
ncbi:hypothetical protein L6164_015835 [Bauhinia variegata]|uniref:Uncharacterized protein n=1 Tax=Bauhinia variegata TaxID=167791 RepID=A0ACB9NMV8_BAUVA|nr:hypothetical protein L6164_015835 [Bauhinia variegata]